MQIVDGDAIADRRAFQPFGMAQGAQCVGIAGRPMFAHGNARKFMVLDVAFIILLLIDQMNDIDLARPRKFLDQAALARFQGVLGHAAQGVQQFLLQFMDAGIGVGVLAGAA